MKKKSVNYMGAKIASFIYEGIITIVSQVAALPRFELALGRVSL